MHMDHCHTGVVCILSVCAHSCGGQLAGRVPIPRIVPEAEQPLEWNEAEWQQGWKTQVRISLAG